MNAAARPLQGALGIAILTAILDQAIKLVVRAELALGDAVNLPFGFELRRVANEGIAFGLFSDGGIVIAVLAVVAFAVIFGFFALNAEIPGSWLAVGLISGGALGNLIDRVVEGAVTDYLDPPAWPAFNLADVAITAGVIVLLAGYLRSEHEQRSADA